MKNKKISKHYLTNFAVFLLFLVSMVSYNLLQHTPVQAIAPGCNASRPSSISGTIVGYAGSYHNWTVNALVGIDLLDANNKRVGVDGNPLAPGSPYSYNDWVNKSLPQPGQASGGDRTFGLKDTEGNGPICVSKKVKTAWFEVYPKNTAGFTDKTYFGGANDQKWQVKAGHKNVYHLRVPTARPHGGNTGDVVGYVKYKGNAISPSNLRFRVWPLKLGKVCGVQGFSGGADIAGINAPKKATWYRIRYIAGGQCGAPKQLYRVSITCINNACGSGAKKQYRNFYSGNGTGVRADIHFK